MQIENLFARQSWPGQHDDERDVTGLRGDHRCDQTALAVADQTDLFRIDTLVIFEKFDSGQHIGGKIFARRVWHAAGRTAHAAIIHAQHSDASPRQIVGNHPKRLMTHEFFIAVLRAGAGDQNDSRS